MTEDSRRAQAMGEDISRLLISLQKQGRPALLFVSGGSALEPLESVSSESLSGLLTITTLDERYDPTGKNSNFVALTKTPFFRRAQMRETQVVDTGVLFNESPEELAARIRGDVGAWMKENPHGALIGVAGIGIDGHTAGIMPFSEDPQFFTHTFESEQLFVSYDAGEKNPIPLRITATMTLVRRLNQVFVYSRGNEKQAAIKRMRTEGSLAECPARILVNINANFYINEPV